MPGMQGRKHSNRQHSMYTPLHPTFVQRQRSNCVLNFAGIKQQYRSWWNGSSAICW